MSKRAVGYSRVSGEKQDGEEHFSISEQKAAIEEYCRRKGYTIVAHYVDNKRYKSRGRWVEPSGTRSDRPQFQAMLKAIRNGEGDLIVAWKGDRLYRGIYSAVTLLEALDESGVSVEGVAEPIDKDTIGLFAWVGQQEIKNTRLRSRLGKRGKAKAGGVLMNRVPFGYNLDNSNGLTGLVPNEEEAAIVHLIYRWYLEGDGDGKPLAMRKIAAKLSDMKIPTRADTMPNIPKVHQGWDLTAVRRVLSDELYCGTWHYGKTQMVNGKRVETPEDEWIAVEVPPVVSREAWEAAKRKREANWKYSRRNAKHPYLLRGLMVCGLCGYAYTGTANNGYHYYRCSRRYKERRTCSGAPNLRQELVEGAVWDYICNALLDPENLLTGLQEQQQEQADEIEHLRGELALIGKGIANLESQEDRWLKLYVSGEIGEERLRHERIQIADQVANLRQEEDRLKTILTETTITDDMIVQVERFCTEVAKGIEATDFDERRQLLETLDVKLTVYPDRLRLTGYIRSSEIVLCPR